MNRYGFFAIVRLIGLVAFVGTLVVPAGALVLRTVRCDAALLGGVFNERYWLLFVRTAGLAVVATLVATVLALPVAFVIGGRRSSWMVSLVTLPLMLPAMVLVFGWQRYWGSVTPGLEGWAPWLRTMWCWAGWGWPVAALVIGAGWLRGGRSGYESALMDASGWDSFRRVGLPNVTRHVAVSMLILFAVLIGEYSVPHANGVIVFSTELLAIAEGDAFDVAGAKIAIGCVVPLLVLVGVIVLVKTMWGRRPSRGDGRQVGSKTGSAVVVVAIVVLTVGVPMRMLFSGREVIGPLCELFVTYGGELGGTFAVCAAVGVVAVCIGVFAASSRLVAVMTLIAMAAGVLPGALIGESMLAAYQRVDAVYNHWPILVLALTGRYAWVGCLACWVATRATARDQMESLRVEGAGSRSEVYGAMLGHHWPTLAGGMFLTGAFALADVDVVSIVAVPSPRMMATILVEKFHRFETGMLLSIGLVMTLAVVPAIVLATIALRRRELDV